MKFAAFEGRIARARAQFVFADAERFVRIDQNEIGWCAFGERAGIESENVGRRRRECAQRKTETDAAIMMQAENDWQQGLQTDRSERRLRKRLALGIGRLRIVTRDDRVDDS